MNKAIQIDDNGARQHQAISVPELNLQCTTHAIISIKDTQLLIKVIRLYGVVPLTESDSDSDILSDPIIMETIKICRN